MIRPSGKKFNKAFQNLWEMIREDLQVGDLLPPETELAARLGMNRQTVAKALNVMVSEGYVTRKAGAGTRLVRKPVATRQGCIMVLTSGAIEVNPHPVGGFERLLVGMHRQATAMHLPLLWLSCQDPNGGPLDIRHLEALYHPLSTQGIVVTTSYVSAQKPLIDYLDTIQCPIVWALASPPKSESLNRVDIQNRDAARDLVSRLIATGARDIACFGFASNTYAREERILGYRDALTAHGIPVREELILQCEGASLVGTGRDCAALYLSRKLSADGLFCADGPILTGVHEFCREFSQPALVEIPAVAFDETTGSLPNLVGSVLQPFEEIGGTAMEVMGRLIQGDGSVPEVRILPYEISFPSSSEVSGGE